MSSKQGEKSALALSPWNVEENLHHGLIDREFYSEIIDRRDRHRLRETIVVPARSGKGFVVKAGERFRVVETERPQIGDLWFFNKQDPKEHFWSNYTMVLEGAYLKKLGRLWSNMPRFRPMATLLEESIVERGGPPHNFSFGSHCTSELWELHSGVKGHDSCHIHGLQAITPFGLTEEYLHDNLNIHMRCVVNSKTGAISVPKTLCRKGDYIEFFAELDLLLALSTCPLGDGRFPNSMPDKMVVSPLTIEIYETGVKPKPFPKWYDWRKSVSR